jgi:hypothetical protein
MNSERYGRVSVHCNFDLYTHRAAKRKHQLLSGEIVLHMKGLVLDLTQHFLAARPGKLRAVTARPGNIENISLAMC